MFTILTKLQLRLDVSVSITGGNRVVTEDAGSVKVCVALDHSPRVPVSVSISTEDGTALGKIIH